jgi:hypothetical protein
MTEFDYMEPELYSLAGSKLEQHESVSIRVRQKSADAVRKAIDLDAQYFSLRQEGKNNRILLFKFGWYAFRTPMLWGLLNKARILDAALSTRREGRDLIITITPPGK